MRPNLFIYLFVCLSIHIKKILSVVKIVHVSVELRCLEMDLNFVVTSTGTQCFSRRFPGILVALRVRVELSTHHGSSYTVTSGDLRRGGAVSPPSRLRYDNRSSAKTDEFRAE